MKVWKINQCDWVFGPNQEEAIKAHLDYQGITRDEAVDPLELHELTQEELEEHTIMDSSYCPVHSFADELQKKMKEKAAIGFFASTEF